MENQPQISYATFAQHSATSQQDNINNTRNIGNIRNGGNIGRTNTVSD